MSKKSGRSKPANADRRGDSLPTAKARHNYNIKDTYEAGLRSWGPK